MAADQVQRHRMPLEHTGQGIGEIVPESHVGTGDRTDFGELLGGERSAQIHWHRHGLDYVVVPISTGRLLIEDKAGERFAELRCGDPYFREVGVEHNVVNANPTEFVFIEIELKP
jgi:hypothetical protein